MRRSDFSSGIEPSSLPPQALPLPDQRRSLGVRMNAFSPPPPPLQPFLGWISGVTLTGTLAQSGLPYGGSLSFETAIRLGLPSHTPSRERVRLSFASRSLVQLPPASGYLQQVPRGTFTLSHSSMPNAPGPRAAKRPRLCRGASGTRRPVPFNPPPAPEDPSRSIRSKVSDWRTGRCKIGGVFATLLPPSLQPTHGLHRSCLADRHRSHARQPG